MCGPLMEQMLTIFLTQDRKSWSHQNELDCIEKVTFPRTISPNDDIVLGAVTDAMRVGEGGEVLGGGAEGHLKGIISSSFWFLKLLNPEMMSCLMCIATAFRSSDPHLASVLC